MRRLLLCAKHLSKSPDSDLSYKRGQVTAEGEQT